MLLEERIVFRNIVERQFVVIIGRLHKESEELTNLIRQMPKLDVYGRLKRALILTFCGLSGTTVLYASTKEVYIGGEF